MDCASAKEKLVRYRQGELALSSDKDLLEHMRTCSSCKDQMQQVLYEADAQVFVKALTSEKPSKDLASEVLRQLPSEKGGKKTVSSGRLKSVRDGKKKRDRSPSSGMLKTTRASRTRATRRRAKDDSGVLFGGNILQSAGQKTGGFIMKYCDDCGERIDPADLDSGAAISHKGATYCPKCKVNLEGVEETATATAPSPKKSTTRQKSPGRVSRPTRGPVPKAAKPVNLPLVGGGLITAALVLIIVIVAVMNSGDTPAPRDPADEITTGPRNTPEEDAGAPPVEDGGEAAPDPEPKKSHASEEEAIEAKIREEERKAEEAKKKKREAIQKLMDEASAKVQGFIDEKKFQEALQVWSDLLDEAEKHGFTEEHRELVLTSIQSVRTNWRVTAQRKIEDIKRRSYDFEAKNDFANAIKVLNDFPEEWKAIGGMERSLNELEQRRHHLKYKWEKHKKDLEAARVKKFRRKLEVGKVYDLLESADHFKAEWYVRNDNVKVNKDKELEFTCDNTSTPASAVANHTDKEKWLDYEVEFEYKSPVGFLFHYRVKRGIRPGSGRVAPASDWTKIRFVISGVSAQLFVNGEQKAEAVIELNPGYLAFTHNGTGVGYMRNIKIKITALEGE
jgi:hypothetical protein